MQAENNFNSKQKSKELNQMNYKPFLYSLLTITILLCASINIQAQRDPLPASENVVLQWNRVIEQTIRSGVHPSATIFPVRPYAMVHAAMFDAVNSIDKSYTPYLIEVDAYPGASIDAAAATAAHGVLVGLYPTRQAVFDAELARSLAGIPENQARLGMIVGRIVAARMLDFRSNDGWNVTPPPYVLPPTPGNWQPTPPAFSPATFTHTPGVTMFALISNMQFDPGPPPALTSARYAEDFNEVKAIGSVNSTTRTAEQTQIALLWSPVNTTTTLWYTWNSVARGAAIQRNLSTVESARLFALINIAAHDAHMTSMTSKFNYGLWRPVTAIRRADEDGNPNTIQDANWSSLIATPPYPSYPGNHAAIGASQATILALVFGRDDIPFQHTWEGAGGATRSYVGFKAMADEESDSRIYAGFHFRFDNVAGQSAGRNVANYIFLNFMTTRR
jgi:hypothetical protein